MTIDITFPAPVSLVPIAETYARTIKRPDIKVEFTKGEQYEYALDGVPTHLHDEFEPVLAPLGALLLDKWVCVAPGVEKIETLRGETFVPWWFVYTYGTLHGGQWAPDELVTRPLCNAQAPEEAIRLALIEVLRNEWDQQLMHVEEIQYTQQDIPQ